VPAVRFGLVVTAVALASACAASRARPVEAPLPPPPLAVPDAPPRELPQPPEPEPGPTEPEAPAPRPRRVRPPSRPVKPPEAAPDAAKTEPAAPTAETPALRSPQDADTGEAAKRISEVLASARKYLAAVRSERLSAEGRTQYATAARFVNQAEGALRARNFLFARYLADKAETLARTLAER